MTWHMDPFGHLWTTFGHLCTLMDTYGHFLWTLYGHFNGHFMKTLMDTYGHFYGHFIDTFMDTFVDTLIHYGHFKDPFLPFLDLEGNFFYHFLTLLIVIWGQTGGWRLTSFFPSFQRIHPWPRSWKYVNFKGFNHILL